MNDFGANRINVLDTPFATCFHYTSLDSFAAAIFYTGDCLHYDSREGAKVCEACFLTLYVDDNIVDFRLK